MTVKKKPSVKKTSVLVDAGKNEDLDCNGQVKQDTLLSRLFIKSPLILDRGLIA